MSSRVLISLENVSLALGGKVLFEDMTLHVCDGDKICLVGRNGAGKTTLMRMITHDLELDGGKRFLLPGIRIGYLAQNVDFDATQSALQFVQSVLTIDTQDEAHEHLSVMLLTALDIEPSAIMGTLSGGQLRRAALAQALLDEPDVLLLDEPTNHLDLGAIQWLEDYLARYKGAVICVSHDRAFLSAISRKVFWIDRAQVRTFSKGYAHFDEWVEQILEQEASTLHNMQKKLNAEIGWTQGGVTARRKRNMRRMNELHKLREKLKKDKAAYKQRMAAIELEAMEPVQASKIIVEFKDVSKSFASPSGQDICILKDFHIRIARGDRIGVLGKNGSGKSTFIKLLTGDLAPDSGRVRLGKTIDITYFDQHRVELDPTKSLWTTLAPDSDYVTLGSGKNEKQIHVCGYLKSFLFDPKNARDRVSTLSGGQQNRLMLAKALAQPGSVLILDEPTNDLDMDTLDMLQDILEDYQGTLIVVSHDRDFLDRTVTEVLAFEGHGVVENYVGGYSDYVRAKAQLEGLESQTLSAKATEQKQPAAQKPSNKTKISYKFVIEFEKLTQTIANLEAEIAALHQVLADASLYTREPDAFDKASRRAAVAQSELAGAEHRWLELDEMLKG